MTARPEPPEPSDAVARWDGPGLDRWRPWTPAEVAAELARVDELGLPWCVVGGWSIDLHLGTVTREHEDLEVAILRRDLPAVRAVLGAYAIHAVGDGEVRRLAPDEEPPPDKHQYWVLDEAADAWRVDLMTEPGDERTWVYRRDERITAPRSAMVGRTAEGIPYLLPHGSLLFKAKDPRPKDEADLTAILTAELPTGGPALAGPARAWLAEHVALLHPDHPWLPRLA